MLIELSAGAEQQSCLFLKQYPRIFGVWFPCCLACYIENFFHRTLFRVFLFVLCTVALGLRAADCHLEMRRGRPVGDCAANLRANTNIRVLINLIILGHPLNTEVQ